MHFVVGWSGHAQRTHVDPIIVVGVESFDTKPERIQDDVFGRQELSVLLDSVHNEVGVLDV